jgi:beta-lactamase regulating signal transducer with metallopeptidase domain
MSLPIPLDWFAAPVMHWLTLALVHFVWQGLAIATVVALLLEAGRNAHPSRRYAVGLGGLFLMATCPLLTLLWYSLQNAPPYSERFTQITSLASPRVSPSLEFGDLLVRAEPYLLTAWAAGVLLFAGRLLVGALGVARLRQSRLPLPVKIAALAAPLGKRLRLNAESLVFISRDVSEAMAVGFLKPLVLIPASWITEMPLDVLEAVIAHELAHLARHDLWVNGFQRVVETLLFYHPAVWWLSQRVRSERELCADELAVAATGKRLEYVQALQHIAAQRQADLRPLLAAFLRGDRNMRLLQRVRQVLGEASTNSSRLWPAGIIAAALPLGLWAALALAPAANADDGDDNVKKPKIKVSRESPDEEIRVTDINTNTNRDSKPRKRSREFVVLDDVIEHKLLDQNGKLLEHKIEGAKPKPKVEVRLTTEDLTGGDRRLTELTVLVKRLSAQVERLQDEVAELRGTAIDRKRIRDADPALKRRTIERDEPRQEQVRERALKDLNEKKLAIELADKQDERAKELMARKQEQAKEQAAEAKERAAEAKERAIQQKERAEQRVRVEKERAERNTRQPKEQLLEKSDDAIRGKLEDARKKIEMEMKELERKLEKLKEGKDAAVLGDIDIELELVPKINALIRDRQALLKQ